MQINVSSTLTLYHDGRFWVGIVERIEDDRFQAARIVFGAEPSDEEVLRFVVARWGSLSFCGDAEAAVPRLAENPKRRQREVSKALGRAVTSTKAQQALAEQRESRKQECAALRKQKREESRRIRFQQRQEKFKKKRRGH